MRPLYPLRFLELVVGNVLEFFVGQLEGSVVYEEVDGAERIEEVSEFLCLGSVCFFLRSAPILPGRGSFLASDQATYVTGEIYGATGGQMPI